jgi:diguanylate cyclase (GGDEF)-like protein/PAS domain S-box-containing protein
MSGWVAAQYDAAMFWTTDRELHVTSVCGSLKDALGGIDVKNAAHVSELWGVDDPFGVTLVAHQWALEGQRLSFMARRAGQDMHVEVEPLYDLSGAIAGVGGRATPGVGDGRPGWSVAALEEAHELCGFGTWRVELPTGTTLWSRGLRGILGVETMTDASDLRAFDHPEDADDIAAAVREGEISGRGYRCDHRVLRADGGVRYVAEETHPVYGTDGKPCAIVGVMLDITERKLEEARLALLAHYDPVSKLPNRTLLEERLQSSFERARYNSGFCAVLFVDVDDFKRVNDTYGHARGDELLAAIGTRLSQHVRTRDTVARMSGDEFVVVLDDLSCREDAVAAARKILNSFELPFFLDAGRVETRVSLSIGVAVHPDCELSPRKLLEAADREMYAVKRNGGRGIKMACSSSSVAPTVLRTAANG